MRGNWDQAKLLQAAPSQTITFIVGIAGVLMVGVLDSLTGVELSFSIVYLLPICFAAWFGGRTVGISTAAFAALIWLGLDFAGGAHYSNKFIPVWNALVRFGFFLFISLLLNRLRRVNATLDAQVQHRTRALQIEVIRCEELEIETLEISQREQERIAQELHDRVAGNLGGMAFRAKAIAQSLERRAAPEAVAANEIVVVLNTVADQIRSFAHLLAPAESGDLGMALQQLAAETRKTFGVQCTVEIADVPELAPEKAAHLCRIAQEGVRNAIQHGQARRIELTLTRVRDELEMRVRNDGTALRNLRQPLAGLGLRIMHHRARILNGVLTLTTDAEGYTLLSCRVRSKTAIAPASWMMSETRTKQ